MTFARLDAPIVLAHGLGGFARLGVGRLTLTTYFRGIPAALQAAGNRVLLTRVPPIASVETRARRLREQIVRAFGDEPVHLIAHSLGGLDARRLLVDPQGHRRVLSLTTIGTPHLGSSLADFVKLRVGRVYDVLAAMGIDPQGCLDVTRSAARRFHERNPLPPDVVCLCVAGDPPADSVCWPLRRLHALLGELEGPNDGLVSVESAHAFGTPLPVWPADHLRQLNWLMPGHKSSIPTPPLELYAQIVAHLAALGFGDYVARYQADGDPLRAVGTHAPSVGELRKRLESRSPDEAVGARSA
ncbi:MAG TPA: alpha/beta fold hydrolase [Isosphaeraceae bacterium]|nr:alpha/beta fold hydrolase [Isosphaeraceae bacterium]